jgi:leucyl-tRNA synthetase
MDMRVSGKDLIGNHLTMSLYQHAAIWGKTPEMWPRSFFTNGVGSILKPFLVF